MISDNALEKAVQSASQGKPEESAPQSENTAPTPAAETAPKAEAPAAPVENPAPSTPKTDDEWDGDVNKLPPEIQGWAKKAQRTLTKKAMAASEDIRLAQEFKQFQGSQDWQAFQQWKQQARTPQAAAPVESVPQQPGSITQQEWEDAQLDPTGQKFQALVNRQVQAKINEAAQVYGHELQQLRTTQQVTQFQQILSDFADLNPDAVDLHNKGILKPFLEEEIKGGRHKSYESAVATAYERARSIRDAIREDAMAAAQQRIAEKRNAVVSTGTSVGEANIAYVDKNSTFDEAMNFAMQGKKVKVKAKQ